MTSSPTGKCALGPNCQFETHELRPSHTCKYCNSVLHVLCSSLSEIDDSICCKIDCPKTPAMKDPSTNLEVSSPPPIPMKTQVTKSIKCKSCGGIGHSRSSSKLCKNYKPRSKASKSLPVAAPTPTPSVIAVMEIMS